MNTIPQLHLSESDINTLNAVLLKIVYILFNIIKYAYLKISFLTYIMCIPLLNNVRSLNNAHFLNLRISLFLALNYICATNY